MYLTIDGWESNLRFSAAHFIPSHTKCSRLHGHDYAVSVTVFGSQEKEFLIDFLDLKKYVEDIITPLDHRVLVPGKGDSIRREFTEDQCRITYGGKSMMFWREDVYLLDAESSSSEDMASFLADQLHAKLRNYRKITKLEVCIEEGPGMGACAEKSVQPVNQMNDR